MAVLKYRKVFGTGNSQVISLDPELAKNLGENCLLITNEDRTIAILSSASTSDPAIAKLSKIVESYGKGKK